MNHDVYMTEMRDKCRRNLIDVNQFSVIESFARYGLVIAPRQAKKVSALLIAANGKRGRRVITINDIAEVCSSSLVEKDKVSHWSGGTVANAYGYPAKTTCVLARSTKRYMYLSIGMGNAKANKPALNRFVPKYYREGSALCNRRISMLIKSWVSNGMVRIPVVELDD